MNEEQEKQLRIDSAVQTLQTQLTWTTQQLMNANGELAVLRQKLTLLEKQDDKKS